MESESATSLTQCSVFSTLHNMIRSHRGSRLTTGISASEKGFTLAEFVIALGLIGLIAMVVLPRFGLATNPLRATGRHLIGTIYTLNTTASTTKRLHRLYLDLDQQTYWVMVVHSDGERAPTMAGLAERITLPPDVRLMDVVTPGQGKVATTRAMIQFTPGGRTDRAMFHLSDKAGNVLTLLVNPLTGSVQTVDRYVEPAPTEPLTDLVKTAFFSPVNTLTVKPTAGVPK